MKALNVREAVVSLGVIALIGVIGIIVNVDVSTLLV